MPAGPADSVSPAPDREPCPRCGEAAVLEHYGPCDRCRAELRATVAGAGREREAAVFEPKMNVTPNAVALKE